MSLTMQRFHPRAAFAYVRSDVLYELTARTRGLTSEASASQAPGGRCPTRRAEAAAANKHSCWCARLIALESCSPGWTQISCLRGRIGRKSQASEMQRASLRLAGMEGQRHTATAAHGHGGTAARSHGGTVARGHKGTAGHGHGGTAAAATEGQRHVAAKGQRYMATEGQQHVAMEGQWHTAMEGQRHEATGGQQHVATRATWQLGALHPASAPPLLLSNWQRSQRQAVHGRSLVDLHTCT